jgi:pimeloyl-ACP methyl ester carboxylesterase/DNA-binding SARP family transcriptional activator
VDLLWDVADDPRGGLRWSLSKLRALLDDEGHTRIVADRDTIRTDTTALDIDARQLLDTDLEAASVEALTALCARIRGEFLEDIELADLFGFHAWCIGLRQDVRRRHARIRERLVALLGGDPLQALPHSRVLCELMPDSEAVHAEHVRLLRGLGELREATAYQRAARARLQQQYGMRELPLLQRALEQAPGRTTPPTPDRGGTAVTALEPPRQDVRFCKSADGTGIAYAAVGQGRTLVKVANWISHLEHELRSPVWRHIICELSRGHRLVRYDQRGNGLSDRKVADLSGPRHVEDLEAVIDACRCEQVPLLGISQGCAIAIEYAARHPERVSHLILYGGFALGWRRHSDALREAGQALATMMRTGWGTANPAFRQLWTSLFIPRGSREAADWFNEMQRVSSDGATAAAILEAVGDFDVRDRLAGLRCPTLVMHVAGDAVIPIAEGKRMAAGIPGALFVSFEGENHLPLQDDPAFPGIMAEIRAFLAR